MKKILELSKIFLGKDIKNFSLEDTKKLQEIIAYHSDLYYNKQNPIISDYEYDELFKKLEILEKKFKNKLEYFQTNLVGAKIESTFKKVKHSRPMISLDNTYNEEDLKDFDERVKKNLDFSKENVEYSLELKFDGLGIELIYKNGKFVQAITRGNGIEGEDVTENIRQIDNIPKIIDYKETLEIRGEVIMPISVFEELNKQARKTGEKIFSNPRNAASGSVRTKDINITKQRKLEFFAYDLANFEAFCKKENKEKYSEVIEDLASLGFSISPYFHVCKNINEVVNYIDNFGQGELSGKDKRECPGVDKKKEFDFEIDGLVIKVNDINLWDKIGWTEHHPRYAIAYKFPAEILTTKILSVDHQVGRTGTITPVANLEPINISGAIIKRATLYNYEEVKELDVRIGDIVFIKRAGEVIPKIISVVKTEDRSNLKKILPPKNCPSCNSLVLKDEDKVRYYCPNYDHCEAQIVERLSYAVGKSGFNIEGLGEKQVKKFFELKIISDLVSIFKLEEKKQEILALEGFQKKSVDNLLKAIDNAKKVELTRFLVALSIPGVGKKTAKLISQFFKSNNDFIDFNYSIEDFENLKDIGPEIAKNIVNYFNNPKNKEILKNLFDIISIKFIPLSNSLPKGERTEFFGKKICITGSFEINEKDYEFFPEELKNKIEKNKISRDNLVEFIENNGAKFVNSVSKNTDFLLAGEKAGSKLEKAKKLGIKIFNLKEFLKRI